MELTQLEIAAEIKKCKDNPFYFATKYLTVNGEPFTTPYSEKEFNEQMAYLNLRFPNTKQSIQGTPDVKV